MKKNKRREQLGKAANKKRKGLGQQTPSRKWVDKLQRPMARREKRAMRDVSPKFTVYRYHRQKRGWLVSAGEQRKIRRSRRSFSGRRRASRVGEMEGRVKGLMRVHNSCGNAVRCTTGSTERSPAILSSSDLPLVTFRPALIHDTHRNGLPATGMFPGLTIYSREIVY